MREAAWKARNDRATILAVDMVKLSLDGDTACVPSQHPWPQDSPGNGPTEPGGHLIMSIDTLGAEEEHPPRAGKSVDDPAAILAVDMVELSLDGDTAGVPSQRGTRRVHWPPSPLKGPEPGGHLVIGIDTLDDLEAGTVRRADDQGAAGGTVAPEASVTADNGEPHTGGTLAPHASVTTDTAELWEPAGGTLAPHASVTSDDLGVGPLACLHSPPHGPNCTPEASWDQTEHSHEGVSSTTPVGATPHVAWSTGRLDWGSLLGLHAGEGRRVGVYVSGPPGLKVDVQCVAHRFGYEVHQETFLR